MQSCEMHGRLPHRLQLAVQSSFSFPRNWPQALGSIPLQNCCCNAIPVPILSQKLYGITHNNFPAISMHTVICMHVYRDAQSGSVK